MSRSAARLAALLGLARLIHVLADRWEVRASHRSPFPFPVVMRRTQPHYQILLYHRVNDTQTPIFSGVPSAVFREQMKVLADRFRVLPLTELLDRAISGDIPPGAMAITFDDGYRDNHEHAFPILREFSLPATIFLTTETIGSGTLLWHDRLHYMVSATTVPSLPWRDETLRFTSPATRRDSFYRLLHYLRAVSEDSKLAELSTLGRALEVAIPNPPTPLMLSWDEVAAMARWGITFGAHTVTHPILSRIPAPQVRKEVAESKATIEQRLGREVTLFAYPNGRAEDFDDGVKDILREAGYRAAVSTIWGTNTPRTDVFALRRQAPIGNAGEQFALRTAWHRLVSPELT